MLLPRRGGRVMRDLEEESWRKMLWRGSRWRGVCVCAPAVRGVRESQREVV